MNCTNCGHERMGGNFCGKCGASFSEQNSAHQNVVIKSVEPNPHIENIKEQTKLYFSYFMRYLKKPSHIDKQHEGEFLNGVMSIVLFAILIGLSFFTLADNHMYTNSSPGFFSLFGSLFIFSLISTGLVLFTLYLINHFFGPGHSFKSMVNLYGSHLSSVIILGAISLLLIFFKSIAFGSILLTIVFLFSFFILPLYLISFLLLKKSNGADPFYGFIIYIVTFSILLTIFMIILADSTISSYLNDFNHFR